MGSPKNAIILDLVRERISIDAFIESFGADPRVDRDLIPRALETALLERSSSDVAHLMMLAFHFGLSASWAGVFARLLCEDWHRSHEDLANALQDVRDPATVDALFEAAQRRLPFRDWDDGESLAVKCIWALHDIGTAAAREKMRLLAASELAAIRVCAQERLAALASREPGDPVASYRRSRERKVRRDLSL